MNTATTENSVRKIEPTSCHIKESAEGEALRLKDFKLWYGQTQALFGIEMDIQKGQVTALIGPSGCGKSTLLRSLNRMNDLIDDLRIDGQIDVGDFDMYGRVSMSSPCASVWAWCSRSRTPSRCRSMTMSSIRCAWTV